MVPATQTAASQATSVLVLVAVTPSQTTYAPETIKAERRAIPLTDIPAAAATQIASVATFWMIVVLA